MHSDLGGEPVSDPTQQGIDTPLLGRVRRVQDCTRTQRLAGAEITASCHPILKQLQGRSQLRQALCRKNLIEERLNLARGRTDQLPAAR